MKPASFGDRRNRLFNVETLQKVVGSTRPYRKPLFRRTSIIGIRDTRHVKRLRRQGKTRLAMIEAMLESSRTTEGGSSVK